MLKNVDIWLGSYLREAASRIGKGGSAPKCVVFSLCDHFEPYWQNSDDRVAEKRVDAWRQDLPKIARKYLDSCGQHPRHMFYYPIEEYRRTLLDMLCEVTQCQAGEVEIHLHHDNDTSENLRATLAEYVALLRKEHGQLSLDKVTGEVKYGFIHGNWCLDNSRPDGRYCGVNDELSVLQQTGCYADFTLPSAPCRTQTRTINSIYYAIDDPVRPKSHDIGIAAEAGRGAPEGLLCIQGPLTFNIYSRKFGLIPRIENAAISDQYHYNRDRLKLWLSARVCVKGRPDVVFVKVHTHGTQPNIQKYLLEGGLDLLYSSLCSYCAERAERRLIFATSRQMYNIVKGLEAEPDADPCDLLDYRLVR